MRPSLRPPWLRQTSLLPWHPRVAPQLYVPRRIATTSAQNAAPVDLPKLIISPGSTHHDSLPSFIAYAKRANLTPEKTYYIGTHYEYTSALALLRLGFSLLRTGAKSDAGIDLIGHWVLGPLREPLPVIIQCKARKISLNPSHVREMEGSFQGTPPGWKKKDVLGLLVTTRKATKGMLDALGQSRWPMGFVLISRDGLVEQFVWNRAAASRGLEGVGVTLRHTPRALLSADEIEADAAAEAETADEDNPVAKKRKRRANKFKDTGTRKDIQLTWMGSPIFPDRDDHAPETVKLMRYITPDDKITAEEEATLISRSIPTGGRPRTAAEPPSPRGGTLGRTPSIPGPRRRGRPVGSKTLKVVLKPNPKAKATSNSKSAGTKTRRTAEAEAEDEHPVQAKTRGRPKGSKNKPRLDADAGVDAG